jgi:hypothetical protein
MSMLLFLDRPATLPVRTFVAICRVSVKTKQHVGCLIGTQQSNSKWTRGERHHIVVVVAVVVAVVIVIAIAVTAVVLAAAAAAVHHCRCHHCRRRCRRKADGRRRHDKRRRDNQPEKRRETLTPLILRGGWLRQRCADRRRCRRMGGGSVTKGDATTSRIRGARGVQ